MRKSLFTRGNISISLILIGILLIFLSLFVFKNIPSYGSSISEAGWAAYQESLTLKHISLVLGFIGVLGFSIGSSLVFYKLSKNGWFFIINSTGLFGVIVGLSSFLPDDFKHYMSPPIPLIRIIVSLVQTFGFILSLTMFVYGVITLCRTCSKKEVVTKTADKADVLSIWSCVPLAFLLLFGASLAGGGSAGFAFMGVVKYAGLVSFFWGATLAVFIAFRFIRPNLITGTVLGLTLTALPLILNWQINIRSLTGWGAGYRSEYARMFQGAGQPQDKIAALGVLITKFSAILFAITSILIGLLLLYHTWMEARKYLLGLKISNPNSTATK